jgi:hypothetical protein
VTAQLAWVLWHARRAAVEPLDYARRLATFYEALEAVAPDGYAGRISMRYESVPWLAADTDIYEEWHLVSGSAVLDPLDDAVFHQQVREPHAALARLAAKAAAGVYRLRFGDARGLPPERVIWLDKPSGETYQSLFAKLETEAPAGSVLWSRHMVLGPTPEFCLFTKAAFAERGRQSAIVLAPRAHYTRAGAFTAA